jgi:hypothetical protein
VTETSTEPTSTSIILALILSCFGTVSVNGEKPFQGDQQAYAEAQRFNRIPRNWVVAVDGKVMIEGVGFGNDGEKRMKQAADVIEKVKSAN